MDIKTQKDSFLNYEADNWFARNKDYKYTAESDVVIKILKEYNAEPGNVLEIGCSKGYRLNAISKKFKNVKVTGLEPSAEAIRLGRIEYPQVNFLHGTADDMSRIVTASFDIVIIGFVLYVVDRDILLKVVSETDRVLMNGGILMIIDFFSEKPIRNPYQHIKDIEAFAYKQNYDEILTSSKLYQLLDKRSMSHSDKGYNLSGDYYDKYTVSMLRKDLYAGYK